MKPVMTLPFLFFSAALAQDKMLPLPKPAPEQNLWDVHYRELEPLLERRLADTPDSLDLLDELARIYRANEKYDKITPKQ